MLKALTFIILMTASILSAGHEDSLFNMEKTITAKQVHFTSPEPSAQQIDSIFNTMNIEYHKIDVENWQGYNYHPDVQFRIAYSPTEIYLQYLVTENELKAVYEQDEESAPYKDSCVEFFCIPGEDSTYYNLEMNCIGKGTFAGGAKRTERTRFGKETLSKIRRTSSLGTKTLGIKTLADNNGKPFTWQLTIALPVELFSLSEVKPLAGRTIKANFYKCGDQMPHPHYLSWNPIGTERPNFHTPTYFGNIHFQK